MEPPCYHCEALTTELYVEPNLLNTHTNTSVARMAELEMEPPCYYSEALTTELYVDPDWPNTHTNTPVVRMESDS
ncbi:hypothetical protein RRG08_040816 [Elysia crispata]|uniref:Uncharacterized protein n=1 Tax=Elysia crispata TaxID=231223 RepID=A0AAE0Z9F4_9GAST|nr:hypothetical protein RRG08_040816 [Elysia crispata]